MVEIMYFNETTKDKKSIRVRDTKSYEVLGEYNNLSKEDADSKVDELKKTYSDSYKVEFRY